MCKELNNLEPKKPWWHTPYTTRELVNLCIDIAKRNKNAGYGPVVHINGKWVLQIRGKHLRRLTKHLDFENRGRSLLATDKRIYE